MADLRRVQTLLRWWYISIAIGFLLLDVRAWIAGDGPMNLALRFIIAVGFFVMARMTARTQTPP